MLTYDEDHRLWFRQDTHDDKIVARERGAYRRRLQVSYNDMLFDLGANIGAVSTLAADHLEYERVVAVEPDPDNLKLLATNARPRHTTVVPKAIVPDSGPAAVNIYSGGKAHGAFSTTSRVNPRRLKYEPTAVLTTTLRQLVAEYGSPTVVKCDIEGGEYDISEDLVKLASIAPDIRRLVIEVHLAPGDEMRRLGERFVFDMLTEGWLMPLDFTPRRLVMNPVGWWSDKKVTEALLTFDWRN